MRIPHLFIMLVWLWQAFLPCGEALMGHCDDEGGNDIEHAYHMGDECEGDECAPLCGCDCCHNHYKPDTRLILPPLAMQSIRFQERILPLEGHQPRPQLRPPRQA